MIPIENIHQASLEFSLDIKCPKGVSWGLIPEIMRGVRAPGCGENHSRGLIPGAAKGQRANEPISVRTGQKQTRISYFIVFLLVLVNNVHGPCLLRIFSQYDVILGGASGAKLPRIVSGVGVLGCGETHPGG